MKVFCKKCTHLSIGDGCVCTHEQNKQYVYDWFSEKYIFVKEPKELNKNNDCPWFKRDITVGD